MKARFAIVAVVLLATFGQSDAKCTASDGWKGPDKVQHFGAGAAISLAATAITGDPWQGFAAGVAVGVVKELYDNKTGHVCSLQDAAITALGAGFGAAGGYVFITPRSVSFHKEF